MDSTKIKQAEMYCGKFEEITPHLIGDKSVDVLFTDLPYGTTKAKWDTPVDLNFLWKEVDRFLKPNGVCLMFAQTPFDKVLGASNLKMLRYEWIWEKTQPTGGLNAKKMPMKAHENILVFYKKSPYYNPQKTDGHPRKVSTRKHKENTEKNQSSLYGKHDNFQDYDSTERYPRSVLKFKSDKQILSLHETQKPLALIQHLLKTYCPPGGLVLDICAGSGTTNQVCNLLGIDSVGIEKDPEIFEKAVYRLENLTI